jgi:glycosyltransferase involved in cell wall biosynthesis
MNESPKISVIALCHNHEKFVREALLSVFAQDYPNFELIIIDDASTDRSREIIHELIRERENVRFIENEQNTGICAAFNRAFGYASGEYIIDFACDDVMPSDRLSRQAEFFLKQPTTTGAIFGDCRLTDENGFFISNYYEGVRHNLFRCYQNDSYALALMPGGLIAVPALMFRRSVFETIGLYDETLAYEDYDFLTRLTQKFSVCRQEGEPLMIYRKTNNSLSKQFNRRGKNRMLHSTALILDKQNPEKMTVLQRRAFRLSLFYHAKESLRLFCFREFRLFMKVIFRKMLLR